MKLSEWAKQNRVSYRTAWRHFKAGKIPRAYQLDTGTIVIPDEVTVKTPRTAVYARVSSSQNRDNLNSQADRLVRYANANGWGVDQVIKETGSGLNASRKKLLKLLKDKTVTRIVVEHKDRLARFGVEYIQVICDLQGCELVILNQADLEDDLMQDFVSLVTSFCARMYGQRRGKRKTEKMIASLEGDND